MTARWTIDDDGDLRYEGTYADPVEVVYVENGRIVYADAETQAQAHAALVAAVRDAELLAKARDMARRFQPHGPGTVDAEYGEVAALLDLLTGDDR